MAAPVPGPTPAIMAKGVGGIVLGLVRWVLRRSRRGCGFGGARVTVLRVVRRYGRAEGLREKVELDCIGLRVVIWFKEEVGCKQ